MKKLFIAVGILIITAAFEQKASMVRKKRIDPVKSVTAGLDTLANKLNYLNELKRNEK